MSRFERGETEMFQANQDIRAYAKSNGIFLWEIAAVVGVNDSNFSRRLRRELSAEEKARIREIIDKLREERG